MLVHEEFAWINYLNKEQWRIEILKTINQLSRTETIIQRIDFTDTYQIIQ